MSVEKGRPLSRAKAYRLREPSARRPLAAMRVMTTTVDDKKHDPTTDCVELKNISMRGTPVVDSAVLVISPMQKEIEIKNMNPVRAPIYTDMTIAFGASLDAFFISSVMCAVDGREVSVNRLSVPRKPLL